MKKMIALAMALVLAGMIGLAGAEEGDLLQTIKDRGYITIATEGEALTGILIAASPSFRKSEFVTLTVAVVVFVEP